MPLSTSHRVWAPKATRVDLVLVEEQRVIPMQQLEGGWFEVTDTGIQPGQRYAHSLDGGNLLPDPRSAHQPEGVHEASAWVDFDTFPWADEGFRPCSLAEGLIYELHVGTFTPEGTFSAAIERLPHLKQLGVTHVELMPVAHFPTNRGWGYDGVALFAPHESYGGPTGLCELVNACHLAGIAVLLDVVYNHLGPSGNYLGQYGPYFTSAYHTPWGEALNFDQAGSHEVRRFICDNALHWLRHYHFDGLRLDATQTIIDQSARHILRQVAEEVQALAETQRRDLVLIAETPTNDPRVVRPPPAGHGFNAQWADDLHHALHAVLTGEAAGYYADYGHIADIARALREGFVYQGQYSAYRDRFWGDASGGLRGSQFVVFTQNHDQVGNRPRADRSSSRQNPGQLKIAAALTLLSPFVPQLFMGEEWGARTPFHYFTDHAEAHLGRAIRAGRKREFIAFGWETSESLDSQAREAFERSRLDWNELKYTGHQDILDWYCGLVALRKGHSELTDDALRAVVVKFDEERRWLTMTRGRLVVACNFSHDERVVPLERIPRELSMVSDAGIRWEGASLVLPSHSCVIAEL